ncbi:MAG: hypothetical protein ACTSV7_04050, partial [Candidatus Baldrarchaeia archaeon]
MFKCILLQKILYGMESFLYGTIAFIFILDGIDMLKRKLKDIRRFKRYAKFFNPSTTVRSFCFPILFRYGIG